MTQTTESREADLRADQVSSEDDGESRVYAFATLV